MSKGLSEAIGVVIILGVVIALAFVFYVIAGVNFSRASASVSISQVETILNNIATDLDAALVNPEPTGVLSYPVFITSYGTYNEAPSFCKLAINGTITYSSDGVIFGVPPSYGSMPSGYVDILLGSKDLIAFDRASNLFNVALYGEASIAGVRYGEFLALYPRIAVFTLGDNRYEVVVPLLVVRFEPGLSNLLVFNVTYPYSINYDYYKSGTYVINYACGVGNELLSSTVTIDGKIEILPVYIYVYYG